MSTVEEFLEHHGVKGMKWGQRRKRGSDGRVVGSPTKTTFKKPAKNLSDAELSKRIKRLEMEKKYTDLNDATVKKGKSVAGQILANSGKQAAATVITGVGVTLAKNAIEKKTGLKIK